MWWIVKGEQSLIAPFLIWSFCVNDNRRLLNTVSGENMYTFSSLCLGLDIESSLKQLAERRTDIFGVEETAIGKKIGEEEIQKPEEKV